jgi:hypothetical protein
MKTVAWIFGVAMIALLGYVAAGPYLAIADIKTGIVEKDADRLSAKVDFPTLRQNLKAQLNARLLHNTAGELKDNPLGALAAGLATTMVDGILDAFVTPAGLAHVMKGDRPSESIVKQTVTADTGPPPKEADLLQNARYSYDSLSQFSVWVPNDEGKETQFVLQREGLSWRLVNLVLPIDDPA